GPRQAPGRHPAQAGRDRRAGRDGRGLIPDPRVPSPAMNTAAPLEWMTLGRITGVFGVRGQLKVQSYTDPVESLLDYEHWRLQFAAGHTAEYRLLEGRRGGKGLVVRLERVDDCDAARLLVGAEVTIARADLPALEENEFFQADLIGLSVKNEQGREL